MKNGMSNLQKIDYPILEKNYIKEEKNMLKEALLILNKTMDIDMLCIKVSKKIKIIHGLFVLPKIWKIYQLKWIIGYINMKKLYQITSFYQK